MRRASVAIAGALSLTLFGGPQPVQAQPAQAQAADLNGVTREFGYITMRDGTKLSYVAYHPTGKARRPVLLLYTTYGGGGTDMEQARPYLDHGYAFVGVDLRGTNCSTGTLSVFDPLIGDDGAQAIEFIGARPWSNGSVGMVGKSYPGHSQIFAAAKRPKYLKAIAAGALTADGYREAWRPGGIFAEAFVGSWAFGVARAESATRRVAWGDKECDVEHAKTAFKPAFADVKDHPLDDDWWTPRHLETYVGDVAVPTLIIQAWQDNQTQVSGATHLYERLKVANKRLVLQPGGHGAYDRDIGQQEMFRWMDRWLKGEKNGVDQEPPVKVLWEVRNVDGFARPTWTTSYASWPPPAAKALTFYLTPDGELSLGKPLASPDNGARSYTSPMGTEMFGDNVQFALAPNPAGVLTYRTAPMKEDMTLLGFSQLNFFFSSTQKDTDFMVVLHDIGADGNTTYVQRDFLRASLREVDEARSNAQETVRSFRNPQPLAPGQVYAARLSIPPVGQVIRRGHRLELAIMAPPQIGAPNWGFILADEGGRNTIYQSDQYPSSLALAVAPNAEAQGPAPPCGSLEFQPCRAPSARVPSLR